MFDKVRSKSRDASARSSTDASEAARRSSDDSNAQLLQVPEQQQQQQISQQQTSKEATSRSSSRGRSPSVSHRNSVSSEGGMRKRDIFWRNGLWDAKGQYPEGPKVRAMSQSIDMTHPEVVEEQMRSMYPQWRN